VGISTTAMAPARPAREWLPFPAGAAEDDPEAPDAGAVVVAPGAAVVADPPGWPGWPGWPGVWAPNEGGSVVVADPGAAAAAVVAAGTVVVVVGAATTWMNPVIQGCGAQW